MNGVDDAGETTKKMKEEEIDTFYFYFFYFSVSMSTVISTYFNH